MKRLLPFLSNLLLAFSFSFVLVGFLRPYFVSHPQVMANIISVQLVLILALAAHSALTLVRHLVSKAKVAGNSGDRPPLPALPRR